MKAENQGHEWTMEHAHHTARVALRLPDPKDADKIALIMVERDCSAWHASALFYGHKCNCRACKT